MEAGWLWCVHVRCLTLMGDVNNERGYTCGSGNIQGISVLSSQFCSEPKTDLKKGDH